MSTQYYDTIMARSGLISYWRMGSTSGETTDEKGAGTIAFLNSPTFGEPGCSLVDDGDTSVKYGGLVKGDYGYVWPNNPYKGMSQLVVEGWVKIADQGAFLASLWFSVSPDLGNYYAIGFTKANKLFIKLCADGTYVIASAIGTTVWPIDTWLYVVLAWDGSIARGYVNNILQCSAIFTAIRINNYATGTTVRLGGQGLAHEDDGGNTLYTAQHIDEVAIYNVDFYSANPCYPIVQRVIYLPPATGSGKEHTTKNTSASNLTVVADYIDASGLLNGVTEYVLHPMESITVVDYDAHKWKII